MTGETPFNGRELSKIAERVRALEVQMNSVQEFMADNKEDHKAILERLESQSRDLLRVSQRSAAISSAFAAVIVKRIIPV